MLRVKIDKRNIQKLEKEVKGLNMFIQAKVSLKTE